MPQEERRRSSAQEAMDGKPAATVGSRLTAWTDKMLRRGQGAARNSQRSSTSDVRSARAAPSQGERQSHVARFRVLRNLLRSRQSNPMATVNNSCRHVAQMSAAGGRDGRSTDADARSDIDAALDALNTVPLLSSVSQVN